MVNVWTKKCGYGDIFFRSLVKPEDDFYEHTIPVKHRGVGHIVFEIIKELISERSYWHAKNNCVGCATLADMGEQHVSGCLKWYEDMISDYLQEDISSIEVGELKEISCTVLNLLDLDTRDIDYYIEIGLRDISPSLLKIQVEQWDTNFMSLINQAVGVFLKK